MTCMSLFNVVALDWNQVYLFEAVSQFLEPRSLLLKHKNMIDSLKPPKVQSKSHIQKHQKSVLCKNDSSSLCRHVMVL